MKPSGHIGLNAIISLPISYYLSNHASLAAGSVFFVSSVIVCFLPDIDMRLQSRDVPFVGSISHRGRTHTLQFAALVSALSYPIIYTLSGNLLLSLTSSSGVFAGILFHLFGDILTPSGIKFIPFSRRNFCLNAFKYDNLIANTTLPVLGLISLIVLYTSPSKPTTYAWIDILIVEILAGSALIISSRYGFRYDGSILRYLR